MKILIITQHFLPTRVAASVRMERFAKTLSKKNKVIVITKSCIPKRQEFLNGYKVIRVGSASKKSGFWNRVWSHVDFCLCAYLRARKLNPDLIIATSPPLFAGFAGALLSNKNNKFVLDIRDLWPESMVVLGVLKNKLFIRLSQCAEEYMYKKADVITTVSNRIVKELKYNYEEKPVYLLMNATDIDFFKPKKVNRRKYNYQNSNFIVSYFGQFGKAQALYTIIAAAKKMPNINFLLAGQGTEEESLRKMSKNLNNVTILPYQPKEKILDLINISDICVVSLAKNRLFEGAIPSKTFEFLACRKPVIACAKGDIEKIIIPNKIGIIIPPENPDKLQQAITKLYSNSIYRGRIAKNGYIEVRKKYSEKSFSKKLQDIIASIQ